MIITIDGPAGAGKSTIAKQIAMRLGYEYLDTGAMYRAVTLLGMRNNVDWSEPEILTELARDAKIEPICGQTFLNGEDVTDFIRSNEVTQKTKYAADNAEIRMLLIPKQREIAEKVVADGGGLISEGRDQGSLVFPNADRKIFLTASPEIRAARRLGELSLRGENADLEVLLKQIN
ncbi:MAG: (d)CMP kinase, partial [Thermoguttaceae bacterium]